MSDIVRADLTFEQALFLLARAQYEYNMLGKVVSKSEPGSLRRACDDEMLRRHDELGDKSKVIRSADGESVATYTVRESKGKPERKARRTVISEDAALAWVKSDDAPEHYKELWLDECAAAAREAARKVAEDYVLLEGELIDGAEVVVETVPAEPSTAIGCLLKIDDKAAMRVFGVPPAVMLLEGADSE